MRRRDGMSRWEMSRNCMPTRGHMVYKPTDIFHEIDSVTRSNVQHYLIACTSRLEIHGSKVAK